MYSIDADYTNLTWCLDSTSTKIQDRNVLDNISSPNEALSRSFIYLLICQCLVDEQQKEMKSMNILKPPSSSGSSASLVHSFKTCLNISALELTFSSAELSLFVGTELTQEVIYKGKKHVLTGTADYSLGYSNALTMSGNHLVVTEAKQVEDMPAAYGQLLSIMGVHHFLFAVFGGRMLVSFQILICDVGMIYRSRRLENKENSVIFGVVTDRDYFHFWRIDNDANVS